MIQYIKVLRAKMIMKKGIGLLQDGKYAEAIRKFEKVYNILPTWSASLINASICYFNSKHTDKAIEYVNRALHDDPENQTALYNKAFFLLKADRKEESL